MLIKEIKNKQLQSRKNRDTFRTSILTTLLGEASIIGKNAGNRLTTDEECIKVIKKFIKNIKETIKVKPVGSELLMKELDILSEFLDDEVTDADLRNQIVIIINDLNSQGVPLNIGSVMKMLKSTISNFDGRVASNMIKDLM